MCPVAVEEPGAECAQATCLPDLTTLGNPRVDPTTLGWGGSGTRANPAVNSVHTDYPDDPVPGIQIEGWFPDSCSHFEVEHNPFIPSCPDGHRHNGQFLIRIPDDWDGQHLVVAGAPGVRTQFAHDLILSDFVLARGWARRHLQRRLPGAPRAGALPRALRRRPGLGGDPVQRGRQRLPLHPAAAPGVPRLPRHRRRGGVPPGRPRGRRPPRQRADLERPLRHLLGAVASTYRPVVDPEYTAGLAAPQLVVPPGHPDADYDYDSRPQEVHDRVAELSNSGGINGRPLITLRGTLRRAAADRRGLRPLRRDGARAGPRRRLPLLRCRGRHPRRQRRRRLPATFRPVLPCFLGALDALDAWVVDGEAPPPSGFVPFPAEETAEERATTCALPERVDRVAGSDRVETAALASRRTFGVSEQVVIAGAGGFADALAAVPLAASLDAPLLLVGEELSAPTIRALERTGAFEALVVGGAAAVPETVVTALADRGLEVRRLAGPDRYATAAAVAAELGAEDGLAFVASGVTFADALAAGPVAARSARRSCSPHPTRCPRRRRRPSTTWGSTARWSPAERPPWAPQWPPSSRTRPASQAGPRGHRARAGRARPGPRHDPRRGLRRQRRRVRRRPGRRPDRGGRRVGRPRSGRSRCSTAARPRSPSSPTTPTPSSVSCSSGARPRSAPTSPRRSPTP